MAAGGDVRFIPCLGTVMVNSGRNSKTTLPHVNCDVYCRKIVANECRRVDGMSDTHDKTVRV